MSHKEADENSTSVASENFLYFGRPGIGSRITWSIIRMTVLFSVGMTILFMFFENSLIFFPDKYPDGHWEVVDKQDPAAQNLPHIDDIRFTASDGTALHGWHCTTHHFHNTLKPMPSSLPVMLWCHGNAGNISDRYHKLVKMTELPINVFIFDYRGYGRSEGKPSEQGLYLDTKAAWDFLVKEKGYSPEKIVIYGNSLGGVPAIELATRVDAAGLIVQSSFTSVKDMAAETMPFIPRFLIKTKMDSVNKVPHITCPKLFIHSPLDKIVPYKLGKRLFDAASPPKEFYEVSNAEHNDIYLVAGQTYFDTILTFIESCTTSQDKL